jgi:hypothetical protein
MDCAIGVAEAGHAAAGSIRAALYRSQQQRRRPQNKGCGHVLKVYTYIGPCHLDFKTTTFDDKNTSFQPTIVVTYISAFLVLNGHFIMF